MTGTRHAIVQRRRLRASVASAVLLLAIASTAKPVRAADLFDTMRDWGNFDTFCALIEHAGLISTFREPGPITVFAPSDRAFAQLERFEIAALKQPAARERLRALILYHVVPGRLKVFDLLREIPRATVQGKTVKSLQMGNAMMVNDAFIDREDIAASNGLVHEIDRVLTPP